MSIKLPQIEPELVQQEISTFIMDKLVSAGKSGGVLGLSGGVDSSTVAYLAAAAFNGNDLKLVCLMLPSDTNSKADLTDAKELVSALRAKYPQLNLVEEVVEIGGIKENFIQSIPDVVDSDYHRGNLSAEIRAVILSRYAAKHDCLILGTGNRDEDYCLGYFTKRGDGAVDISPIGELSKRLVKQMAAHLGVPKKIIEKKPSAGLWIDQTDEGELGFTYEFAELVLAGKDQGMTKEEIATELGAELEKVEKVLRMHKRNMHKMSPPELARISFK